MVGTRGKKSGVVNGFGAQAVYLLDLTLEVSKPEIKGLVEKKLKFKVSGII